MPLCDVCGNNYDKTFEVVLSGRRHVFDSIECAIHALSPRCEHCRGKIVGHGIEYDGRSFCSIRCAEASGVAGAMHRVD
jgi:hypothetical protein